MALSLFLHALAGIYNKDGGIGLCRSSNHVFQELPVPWGVNQHILAKGGTEVDVRHIDRDSLIPFRLKGIHEKSPFKRHAAPFTHCANCFEFPFWQRTGIMK